MKPTLIPGCDMTVCFNGTRALRVVFGPELPFKVARNAQEEFVRALLERGQMVVWILPRYSREREPDWLASLAGQSRFHIFESVVAFEQSLTIPA